MNIEPVVVQAKIAHRRHGNDREGLVDLVEIHVDRRPADPLRELADGTDRGGAVENQAGAAAWLACPRMTASGVSPACSAADIRASASAAAPSEIDEALAAVTVSSGRKAGFTYGPELWCADVIKMLQTKYPNAWMALISSETFLGQAQLLEHGGYGYSCTAKVTTGRT